MDRSEGVRASPDISALTIRPARRSDLDALVAIENAAFAVDRLSRRSFSRFVKGGSAILLVAEGGGRLLGGCVVLLRAYSHRARLYSLASDPAHAGRGIGTALLRAAENAAAARGCHAMTLEVREDNPGARRLYERHGYALIGRSPGYYSDGRGAMHYRKPLIATAEASARAAA